MIRLSTTFFLLPSSVIIVESERPAKIRRCGDDDLSDHWKSVCHNIFAIFDTPGRDRHLISPSGSWELICSGDMYIREFYTETAEEFRRMHAEAKPKHPACLFITGTSGVGKSGLLEYLLLCLVKEAQAKGETWTIRLRKPRSEKLHAMDVVLSTPCDGDVFTDDTGTTDFLLSDSVAISDGDRRVTRRGCVLATSEKPAESNYFDIVDFNSDICGSSVVTGGIARSHSFQPRRNSCSLCHIRWISEALPQH